MRGLIVAVSFLTRLPVGRGHEFGAKDVAQSARWFPLVGGLLGGLYASVLWVCAPTLPSVVAAVVLAGVNAGLTGAMHLDGLADSADGFGGGRTREDVLRIMRDPSIGAYGAIALVLMLAMRIATVAALIDAGRAVAAVAIAPVLGRWSAVFTGATQSYARARTEGGKSPDGSPARWMGAVELIVATISTAVPIVAVMFAQPDVVRGPAAWALVAAVSAWWAWRCRRRIGGVTGDTLGAGIEISECLVLLLFTALR